MRACVGITLWWLGALIGVAQQMKVSDIIPLYPDGHALFDGVVISPQEILLVGGEGTLLWSFDGGETWERHKLPNGDRRTIYSVDVGKFGWMRIVGENGLGFFSLNSGRNWAKMQLPTKKTLYKIRVIDEDQGHWIAVGEGGTILTSYLGPGDWQRTVKTDRTLRGVDSYGKVVVVVGEDGVILRSSNRGATWEVVRAPDSSLPDLFDVVAVSENNWFAVGALLTMLRSTDAGRTWSAVQLVEPKDSITHWGAIWFADTLHGWVIAQQFANDQPMWVTSDGGNSWTPQPFRIDTVQPQGGGWWTYYTQWQGIRTVGERLLLFGSRSGYAIVAVGQDQQWQRKVWDRWAAWLVVLLSAELRGCQEVRLVLGYPGASSILRYNVATDRWDTVALLPRIEYETSPNLSAQWQFKGARAWRLFRSGKYRVLTSDHWLKGWWSPDSGKSWEILDMDSVQLKSRIFAFGNSGFGLVGVHIDSSTTPPRRLEQKLMLSTDGGKSWYESRRASWGEIFITADFWDAQTGWLVKPGSAKPTTIEIWHTTDGGAQWTLQSQIAPPIDATMDSATYIEIPWLQVYSPTDLELFAVTLQYWKYEGVPIPDHRSAFLFTSTDGGVSWDTLWVNQLFPIKEWGNGYFLSQSRQLKAALWQNKLVYTRNGGRTWDQWVLPLSLPKFDASTKILADYNGECACIIQRSPGWLLGNQPARIVLVFLPSATAVEETSAAPGKPIEVYPNPAKEKITVRCLSSLAPKVESVAVYSVDGQLLWQQLGMRPEQRIFVAGWPAGQYFIIARMQSGTALVIPFQVAR